MTAFARRLQASMRALALPKGARLSRRREFAIVRERGVSWHGRHMVLGAWSSGGGSGPRLGVVTSRKVGRAVDRTRVRRRFREIFRIHRAGLPAGLWMVVIARRAAATATFRVLSDEWCLLSARAGLLKA